MKKKGTFQQARKREDDELDQAFEQVTAMANGKGHSQNSEAVYPSDSEENDIPDQSRRKKLMIISCVAVSIVLIAAALGIWWFLDTTKDDGLIYSNVYAFGINLGGMTPEQASQTIHEMTDDTYPKNNLTIELPDCSLILAPSSTKPSLDVQKLIDAAYNFGRTGNRWENYQAKMQSALSHHDMDVLEFLSLDTTYIEDLLDQVAKAAASELKQTEVTVSGKVPDLNRTIEDANEDSEVEHMTMTFRLGTPYRALDTKKVLDTILNAYANNNFTTIHVEYDVKEPDPLDFEKLFKEHCVAPVDAVLNEQTYEITPEVLGYGFDAKDYTERLSTHKPGEEVTFEFRFLNAKVTKASLEEHLFHDTLASVDTDHTNIYNRTNNLILASEAIDGTIIPPGGIFSFNDIVGERTAEKGYLSAAIYSGGETVDGLGGGVCQVASTIYYAALLADLEIVERTEHMFEVSYVPPGMDATIYWGSLDFQFRNNTEYPIRVDASVYGGQVHVELVGTDTKDYYVEMDYETTDGPYYGETKYKIYPENNPQGYEDGDVLQTAYTGRTIRTYRCKYSKATDELISCDYEATSDFAKRDRIVVAIGDPNGPTTPDGRPVPTTAAPTTKPTTAPTAPPTTAPTTPPTTVPPATAAPEVPEETATPDVTEATEAAPSEAG